MVVNFSTIVSTFQVSSFHVEAGDTGYSYPPHHHKPCEFLYSISGIASEWVGHNQLIIQPGDWLILPPGVTHSTDPTSMRWSYLSFVFDIDDPEFRQLFHCDYHVLITAKETEDTKLPALAEELASFMERMGFALETFPVSDAELDVDLDIVDRMYLQYWVLGVIQEIVAIRDLQYQRGQSKRPTTLSAYEVELACAMKELMAESYPDRLCVSTMANDMGLSRCRFSKLFRKVYGIAPREYITSLRLNHAKELLIQTDMPIQRIGERLGFGSASHFSRQFKRWTGVPPQHYRPRHSPDVMRDWNQQYPQRGS